MAEQDEPYTVVVGVSATSKSPTALAWGAGPGPQNGGRLVAVRAHAPSRGATRVRGRVVPDACDRAERG